MPIEWNQYLQLPEAALQSKRIPKTVLVAKAGLSRTEQKALAVLKELRSYAVIGKSTTGILPHVDSVYDIRAVIYLDCALESWDGIGELAMILHRAFPNPTVLLMGTEDPLGGRMLSVALKRRSLAKGSAAVVESVDSTDAIDPMDVSAAAFWSAIQYDALPQSDLLDYVHGVQDAVSFCNVRSRIGFVPKPGYVCRAEVHEELARLKRLDAQIAELASRRRSKDVTFGESAEIRVIESGKKEEAQTIVNHIKELCQ